MYNFLEKQLNFQSVIYNFLEAAQLDFPIPFNPSPKSSPSKEYFFYVHLRQ